LPQTDLADRLTVQLRFRLENTLSIPREQVIRKVLLA
jgi:hypothetical protein